MKAGHQIAAEFPPPIDTVNEPVLVWRRTRTKQPVLASKQPSNARTNDSEWVQEGIVSPDNQQLSTANECNLNYILGIQGPESAKSLKGAE